MSGTKQLHWGKAVVSIAVARLEGYADDFGTLGNEYALSGFEAVAQLGLGEGAVNGNAGMVERFDSDNGHDGGGADPQLVSVSGMSGPTGLLRGQS